MSSDDPLSPLTPRPSSPPTQSLRILFNSKDLSKVKAYVEAQWTKILSNRVSIQDFVFAREVRCGPAAACTPRAMSGADPLQHT